MLDFIRAKTSALTRHKNKGKPQTRRKCLHCVCLTEDLYPEYKTLPNPEDGLTKKKMGKRLNR